MENVQLISIKDIYSITSISDNIDDEAITGFLANAQLKYIESAVGSAMYEDMLNVVSTGGTKYQLFFEAYLYPALAFLTISDWLPFGHYKIQKKGITKSGSDSSVPVDMQELTIILKRTEATGNFYLNRMIDYLNDNKELYPLYRGSTESKKRNSSSIHIPKLNTSTYNPNCNRFI